MLIVELLNVDGDVPIARYDVVVRVNARMIHRERVEGHRRSDGWRVLLQKFLEVGGSRLPGPPPPQSVESAMKFRKKPVVIEAVQYTGRNLSEIMRFAGSAAQEFEEDFMGDSIAIKTLEGTMRAERADWIIRGIKGEFYPCKPDIFAATYEPVEAGGSTRTDPGVSPPD